MAAHCFLYLLRQLLQCIIAHVTALACTLHATNELVATKWLSKTIAFDYQEDRFFNSGKSAFTG